MRITTRSRFPPIARLATAKPTAGSQPVLLTDGYKRRCADFWQQFGSALEIDGDKLTLEFFAASDAMPSYGCRGGEAKSWEAWLTVGRGRPELSELARTSETAARPVRLFNPEYFCATEGLGYAYPHEGQFALVGKLMADRYPRAKYANISRLFGVRDFGDEYYTKQTPTYRNNYYDVMRGMFGEYLMGGEPEWFDRGEETARQFMDIDQLHDSARTHDLRGANTSVHTPNHNDDLAIWPAMLRQRAAC